MFKAEVEPYYERCSSSHKVSQVAFGEQMTENKSQHLLIHEQDC
jgi:hypothetical protein